MKYLALMLVSVPDACTEVNLNIGESACKVDMLGNHADSSANIGVPYPVHVNLVRDLISMTLLYRI